MKNNTFKTLISKSTKEYGFIIDGKVQISHIPFLLPITAKMSDLKKYDISNLDHFTLTEITCTLPAKNKKDSKKSS